MKTNTDAFPCDADPCRVSALAAEVEGLAPSAQLVANDRMLVAAASAREIPLLLDEIGRLRESAFRAIGEGTGAELDLDRFDAHYTHLFVWDRRRQALAGAYRLVRVDGLAEHRLPRALYTHTLFDYDRAFLARLGPALELGRAFVTPEYQRCSRVLALLWQGIGRAVRSAGARRLFGAVSVSASYSRTSRGLIAAALLAHHRHRETQGLVRARTPFALAPEDFANAALLADPRALSQRVAELEPDGSGLPVLVRRYLELGGEFAAWHVDREFGDSLDGLMVLDLERADPVRVARFSGDAGPRYSGTISSAARTSSVVS
ncbi:MAG TPA: GNAT family N-acyltransferase [Myxococcota bacterium]|nr:GNAT family N-acyltransferase [Myxococcota bacterium]